MSTSPVLVIGAGPAGLAVAASLGSGVCPPSCSSVPTPSAPRGGGTTSGSTCTPPAAGRACRACRSRTASAGGSRARTSSTTSRCTPCTTGSTCAPASQVKRVDARRLRRLGASRPRRGSRSPASTVVVATGYNHTPVRRQWPGVETFPGELVHASTYRNAEPYRGKDVLVVGVGQHRVGDRRRPHRGRGVARPARHPHGPAHRPTLEPRLARAGHRHPGAPPARPGGGPHRGRSWPASRCRTCRRTACRGRPPACTPA